MEDAETPRKAKKRVLGLHLAGVPADTTECLEDLDFSASQHLGGEAHVRNQSRFSEARGRSCGRVTMIGFGSCVT